MLGLGERPRSWQLDERRNRLRHSVTVARNAGRGAPVSRPDERPGPRRSAADEDIALRARKSSARRVPGLLRCAAVSRRRYVARGVPGGYRIWDNRRAGGGATSTNYARTSCSRNYTAPVTTRRSRHCCAATGGRSGSALSAADPGSFGCPIIMLAGLNPASTKSRDSRVPSPGAAVRSGGCVLAGRMVVVQAVAGR